MTISDLIDNLNDVYTNIDDMTQIPEDIRADISILLEDAMDKLDNALNEYGDDPDDSNEDYEDDED